MYMMMMYMVMYLRCLVDDVFKMYSIVMMMYGVDVSFLYGVYVK